MANEITTKTTIFKVVLDKDDYAKGAADLGKDIDNLKAKQKELEFTTGKNTAEYQRVTAQLKLTQAEQRKLTDLQKAAITVEKAQEGSNQKLRSQLTLLTDQYNKLSKEQRENTTAGKELGDSIAGITAELKLNEGAVGDTRRNVGNYTESIVAAGEKMKVTTVFTDENRKANLGLQNQMEASARSAAAIGGAFALLSNIIGDNEKAQNALRIITLAVAAATALSNVAKEKGAILDTIAFVKTKALTVAQNLYTTAVKGSTLAMTGLKVAIAATGIGALVIGITSLIERLKSQKDATDSQAESQEALNEELATTTSLLDDITKQYEGAEGGFLQVIGSLERLLKLREAEGANELELIDIKKQLINAQIQQAQTIRDVAIANDALRLDDTIRLNEQILNLQTDLAIVNIQRAKLLADEKALQDSLNSSLNGEAVAVESIATNYEKIGDILISLTEDKYPALKMQTDEQIAQQAKLAADAKDFEEQRRDELQKTAEVAQNLSAEIGVIFADSITDAGFQVENFFRRLMVLNIDILQRQLLAAIAEIYFKQIASKGFAGIATGAALTAIVVGATEAAKAALSKPVKFERGGEFDPFGIEVGGRLHSQGGTKYYGEDGNVIELEKGERLFVNNRKSSALIGALATINQAMGGRGLSGSSSYLADGGFASRSISDSVNSQFQSARLAADIVRNLPEFTVSVTELNRVQAGASNVRVVTTL